MEMSVFFLVWKYLKYVQMGHPTIAGKFPWIIKSLKIVEYNGIDYTYSASQFYQLLVWQFV